MKYTVEIVSRQYATVKVEADSRLVAQQKVLEMIRQGEITWGEPAIDLWRTE